MSRGAARGSPATARAEFPATRQWTYLDVASRAPMPDRVAAELGDYIATYQAEGVPKGEWLDRVERVRARTARLLHADPQEVAFTKSTSDGINQLAHALGLGPGDNVVVCPEIEHANNLYPWLHLRDRGLEVRMVEAVGGELSLDRVAAAVDARTRVLALSSVSFVTGARADLDACGTLCRDRDVFLLVDGVQELGALPMDPRAAGVDGLVAATQKMLLGAYGLGLMWCRSERIEQLRPPFLTRMGVDWGEGHEADLGLDYRLADGAARFEVGNPNFAGVFTLDAALSLLEEVGQPAIADHVLALARRLMDGLTDRGIEVVTPTRPTAHAGIVVFDHPRAEQLHAALEERGVKLALRRGALRASVHLFNAEEDVDTLLAHLDDLAHLSDPNAPTSPDAPL
ncbi:aminotransferase class V-fold PLP-dependent enzyme [Egibacter rhizosphaerae]|uniref:Aminotransferase class V-fold PLP-dependent enzyme n=1 Tax=Egibacter rhizosphaerae TaxID=1670831 RepID=A0A411YH19_9ACTN|nr:aminotransferase class V-fold PLP-dependent enzyme [Egibacter rhizosphaerae]QBI20507.1 aminotransferase class V-fold PLP-dependent enzyme [Egibacter rhizosphaerae]